MTYRLDLFLRRAMSRPFAWGECDCALWCCDWIALCRGIDPAAPLRGTYADAASCAALLAAEGGLACLAGRLFAAAGLDRVAGAAAPGDIGLVETPIGPALMIAGDRSWAWKARRGLRFLRADPAIVWGV